VCVLVKTASCWPCAFIAIRMGRNGDKECYMSHGYHDIALNIYSTDKRTRFVRKWISYITEINKLESTIMAAEIEHLPTR
jgi:hypothetical protein